MSFNFADFFAPVAAGVSYLEAKDQAGDATSTAANSRANIDNAIGAWMQPIGGTGGSGGFTPVQYQPVSYVAGSRPEMGYNGGGFSFGGQTTQAPAASATQNWGFNEEAYLSTNKDVADAVARGDFTSGADHYAKHGQSENRLFGEQPVGYQPGPSTNTGTGSFDNDAYLAANPDVAAAVARGEYKSGMDHYEKYGKGEGRSVGGGEWFTMPKGGAALNDGYTPISGSDIAGTGMMGDMSIRGYRGPDGKTISTDDYIKIKSAAKDSGASGSDIAKALGGANQGAVAASQMTDDERNAMRTFSPNAKAGNDPVSQAIRANLAAIQATGGGQAALDSFLVSGRYTPEQLAAASGYGIGDVQGAISGATGRGAKPPVVPQNVATFGASKTPGGQQQSAAGRATATGAAGGTLNRGAQGDFYNQQVAVNGYNTAGVDDRASQIYARLVGGVDRANAIAASQGFASSLRNGLGNSTTAAATSDELTRKFSDVYSKLAEDAAKGALSENQSNYASYLSGNQQAINQNTAVAGNNNNMNASIMGNDTTRMNAALQANTSLQSAQWGNETQRGNAALNAMIQMYSADRVSLANAQNARGQALNSLLSNPAIQGLGQSALNAVLSRLGNNPNPSDAQVLDAIRNNPDLTAEQRASMLDIFGNNYTGNQYDDVGVGADWWADQGVDAPGYTDTDPLDYFYTN